MEKEVLQNLLISVAEGRITPSEAAEKLKTLPYDDIGFAKLDTHRGLRTGRGEVVFGIGKTPEQVAAIMDRLSKDTSLVITTKASPEHYEAAKAKVPEGLTYYKEAQLLAFVKPIAGEQAAQGAEDTKGRAGDDNSPRIAIICAGTADIPIAEEAAITSELYGATVERFYDVGVAGIHRLLDKVDAIRKAEAVVAVAGMEGAIASVVGGLVDVPVIAVPTSTGYGASMGGFAALLTMLNSCSLGVSVVNIDNGFGAGYLASLIAGKHKSKREQISETSSPASDDVNDIAQHGDEH